MFTGIIEQLGEIVEITTVGSNKNFRIKCGLEKDLYIDQSIAHNGVCLTVVDIKEDGYTVTAIKETLDRTNLGGLSIGDQVNLERATMSGKTRMDGHMVQGHIDGTTVCTDIQDEEGSWVFTFALEADTAALLVDKGSVTINGVSLTVVSPTLTSFSVAIIPYTYAHTTFRNMKVGDAVNLEYDIIGKYVMRYMDVYSTKVNHR